MVTCVVTITRKLRPSHRYLPLSSPHLLRRQKLHACKHFVLCFLPDHAATNLFFCYSCQKPGSTLPPTSPVNSSGNSLVLVSRPIFASATPLLATLARHLTCVAFKRLAENLSSLLAALTKNRGRGSNHPYISFGLNFAYDGGLLLSQSGYTTGPGKG
jgi:hypothetical protein